MFHSSSAPLAGLPLVALCVLIVAALCVPVLGSLAADLRKSNWAFGSDEGLHAMWALSMANDLQAGDLRAFLADFYRQDRRPPLSRVLQLPALLLAPPNPSLHRLSVLLLLPLSLIPLWLLGGEAAGPGSQATVAAMTACLLAVTAPANLAVSTCVMMEPAAITLMLAVYVAYCRGVRHLSPRSFGAAGWLLLATWFCKWQCGALTTLVTLADSAVRHGVRPRAMARDRSLWRLYLPCTAGLAAWMANPIKAREFLMYLTYSNVDTPASLLARVAYWVALLPRAYTAGPILAAICLGGVVLALGRLQRPVARVLLLHGVLALVLSSTRYDKYWHMGLWYAPSLWALGGVVVGRVWLRAGRRSGHWAWLALGLVGVLFALTVPGALAAARSARDAWVYPERYWEVYEWIHARVPGHERIVTLGGWSGPVNPFTLKWLYMARDGVGYADLNIEEWPPRVSESGPVNWRWPWQIRKRAAVLPEPSPIDQLRQAGTTALVVISVPPQPLQPVQQRILNQIISGPGGWILADAWDPRWGGHVRLYRPPRAG